MARPPLSEERRRSEVYQIRLTKAEKATLDAAAEKLQVPLSELMREAVISKAKRVLKE